MINCCAWCLNGREYEDEDGRVMAGCGLGYAKMMICRGDGRYFEDCADGGCDDED